MSEEKQPIPESVSAANDAPKNEDNIDKNDVAGGAPSDVSAPESRSLGGVSAEDQASAEIADASAVPAEGEEALPESSETASEQAGGAEDSAESSAADERVQEKDVPSESTETVSASAEESEQLSGLSETDRFVQNGEPPETAAESPSAATGQEEALSETADDEAPRLGYTGEILGEVVSLSSLEAEQEAADEEQAARDDLVRLIDSSLRKVSPDEIVTGRVISVGEKDVVIDIGFKSDGIISRNEFSGEVKEGEEVDVYLERLEDYHGQLQLSKDRAEQVRRWEEVEDAFNNGTVLEGVIVRRIKGGMIVNLLEGLEAFLPGSQIDMRPVRDFDAYLDRRMQFKIVKINVENENVVVSHKALIERELASQRESILSTMETGQVLEGIAKNITDFGVFVDLGGVDGLLHITDLTWGRVSHPTEVVTLDQELKVVVLDYDRERQRISLGLKQLQPHPWENIEERYKAGDIVEGKVVSITDYGAFLELEQGIEGLVHVSEMSWTGHIRHPSQRVSLGQMVKVSVLSIDHGTKKISLGMKQFEVNPWEGIATRYPPGTILRGHVRNITHFGAFVEIEPGIDGLVHVSDLSWTKTIRHPSEIIKKRQELAVVVLDVDEKRQRIALGHKQIETNPWTHLASVYETGSDHKARVVRIERKGLTVELPLEVEAYVPAGELKNKQDSGFPPYQEGDELDLRVIRLDVNHKEIVMSETARERQREVQERQKDQKAKRSERRAEEKAVRRHAQREKVASGPTTIGELSGLESLKEKMEKEEGETSEVEIAEEKSTDSGSRDAEAAETPEESVEAREEAAEPETSTEEAVSEVTMTETGEAESSDKSEGDSGAEGETEAPEEMEESPEAEIPGESESEESSDTEFSKKQEPETRVSEEETESEFSDDEEPAPEKAKKSEKSD